MILMWVLYVRANLAAWRDAAALVNERCSLLAIMTWRELTDRYAGQALGAAWAVISPLLMMATYMLAFGVIFRGRIGPVDNGTEYVAFMLAGLVPWMAMQDCVSRATSAITGHANLVEQVVFPNEILPLRVALSSMSILLIGLIVTISARHRQRRMASIRSSSAFAHRYRIFRVAVGRAPFWLAAIGVLARDIKDLISFLLGIGLFLHPVLYPPASVPSWLGPWFMLSPFSHMIWCFRDALTLSNHEHIWSWLVFPLVSISTFTMGWRGYRMLKPTFGNAL